MTPGVVYLSHGRLFLKKGEGPPTAIESKFAESRVHARGPIMAISTTHCNPRKFPVCFC